MSAKPLAGKLIVVTRASEQARGLSRLLGELGARVLEIPVLTIVPVAGRERELLTAAVDRAVAGDYQGLLFTSSNAVAFFDACLVAHDCVASAVRCALFAVGQATAQALIERGYALPRVAAKALAESLLLTIRAEFGAALAGRRLLWPCARQARQALVASLRHDGAWLDAVVVYDTSPVTDGPGLPAGETIDWLTFASPSAVRAFLQRFGRIAARVACIGAVTAEAARDAGWSVAAIADEQSAQGLAAALVKAVAGKLVGK